MLQTQSVSLEDWAPYRALAGAWTTGVVRLRAAGLWGSARALVVAALLEADRRPCLVLVSSLTDAQRWAGDLRLFGGRAVEFPPPEPRLWRGGRCHPVEEQNPVARGAACPVGKFPLWCPRLGEGGRKLQHVRKPLARLGAERPLEGTGDLGR